MQINLYPELSNPTDDDCLLIQTSGGITRSIKLSTLKTYIGVNSGTPATPAATQLSYVSNGDTNGVFYYIGTNKLQATYANPANSNLVIASSLSQYSEGASAKYALDRLDSSLFHSLDAPNQYWQVDLLANKSLIINGYSIRGRADAYGSESLRNWKLQASNDGTNWVDLDTRINDTQVNNSTWFYSAIAGQTVAYRYFRILQNAPNADNRNYLALGRVEFYGALTWTN